VKNFLTTLAENNRLGALEGVCEKFGQLMSAHKGEVELIVTSAAVSEISRIQLRPETLI
jgi:F-type H+-transporting ATPase subunit O